MPSLPSGVVSRFFCTVMDRGNTFMYNTASRWTPPKSVVTKIPSISFSSFFSFCWPLLSSVILVSWCLSWGTLARNLSLRQSGFANSFADKRVAVQNNRPAIGGSSVTELPICWGCAKDRLWLKGRLGGDRNFLCSVPTQFQKAKRFKKLCDARGDTTSFPVSQFLLFSSRLNQYYSRHGTPVSITSFSSSTSPATRGQTFGFIWGRRNNSGGERRLPPPCNVSSSSSVRKPDVSTAKHLRKNYRMGDAAYRIQKELKHFLQNPPPNCQLEVHSSNIRIWIITITGVEGTVYAGEKYKLKVQFPDDYPLRPPSVYFLQTPPRHPHVYSNGDICLNFLGADWKPTLRISAVALAILSMLSSAKEKKLPFDNAARKQSFFRLCGIETCDILLRKTREQDNK